MSEIEIIGRSYKPDEIKLLYLAECPKSANSHFYNSDSPLYRHIKESFRKTFKDFPPDFEFLNYFKEKKCYLIYLFYEPLVELSDEERIRKSYNSVASLSDKIKECAPNNIIMIMKQIEDRYREAIKLSRLEEINHIYSLPAGTSPSVIEKFIEVNSRILKELHI